MAPPPHSGGDHRRGEAAEAAEVEAEAEAEAEMVAVVVKFVVFLVG